MSKMGFLGLHGPCNWKTREVSLSPFIKRNTSWVVKAAVGFGHSLELKAASPQCIKSLT